MPGPRKSPHAHGRSEYKDRGAVAEVTAALLCEVGSMLRSARHARGLTLEQAAESIGLHAKYLQRLERGNANPTLGTLAAVSVAYGVSVTSFFSSAPSSADPPFRSITEGIRPFENALPLYPLHVAAGAFGSVVTAEHVAPEGWVVPLGSTRPRPGLFVAQVVGESMNRRIPSGAFCVFRSPVVGSRGGRILLACHRDIQDPEHGGSFTLKRYESTKTKGPGRSWRHEEVTLIPESFDPTFQPIVLRGLLEGELTIVAELVEVLPGRPLGNG